MQAKVEIGDAKNLYEYWHDMLYRSVIDESRIIINLASKEYSKCIEKYLTPKDKYITISFCEQAGNKLVTKGTYAKMARGEMVRFMAAHFISSFWFEILPVIHLTMVKADLDHPALEKVPFYEARLQAGNKLVTKGTYAKMARGEMVRFMAENDVENPDDIKKFDRLGYIFRSDLSSDSKYVFERKIA